MTLNQQITIQAPSASADALGQPVAGWTDVCTVWADILHPGGLQHVRADSDISRVRASIRIRQRSDITPAMRVVHGTTVYGIKAVLPDARGRVFMDLACESVQ